MKTGSKLALIAGQGDLPQQILSSCEKRQQAVFIVAIVGQTDPALFKNTPHAWVHLGEVGKTLTMLKEHEITDIVMAGSIKRPSWSELRLDTVGTKWLAKIGFKSFGDDGLLKAVIQLFLAEGFHVLKASDILENLIAMEGVWGKYRPDKQALADIDRGIEVLKVLGNVDVGQAAVVQQGLVLGLEAIEGTANLISRCQSLRREGAAPILVKIAKPGQDHRADLPTIGIDTIFQAHTAGLRGVAVQAGLTQVLNHSDVVAKADELGLFLIGVQVT